jgi:hypothetical protein
MIESLLGYIIGGFSLIAGLAVMLIRNVDTELLDSRRTIKDEYMAAYREFADTIGESIDAEKLKMSVRRLKDLHYASHWDLLKLRIIEWLISKSFLFMVFVWGFVAISLFIGHLGFDINRTVCRVIFLNIFPLLLLAIQILYVAWMMSRERYLKRIKEAYNNLEYPS